MKAATILRLPAPSLQACPHLQLIEMLCGNPVFRETPWI